MMEVGIRIQTAREADANQLADIRVEAMRPSLEEAGLFDPGRARDRFLRSFCAEDTKIILLDNQTAGFFVLRRRPDHLYLDHIYVISAFQSRGIGKQIINVLKDETRSLKLPIRLIALNGSPANEFYLACGFAFLSKDSLDTQYEWSPQT